MRFPLTSAFLFLGSAVAQQLCDTECQKGCDASCQAAIQASYEKELDVWVSDTAMDSFFDTPTNFTNAKPGDVLKWEDISPKVLGANYSIPAGLSLSRYMYVTEDINRQPIPATGFAIIPWSNPHAKSSKDKLRTVVWTHGTAGRSIQCAPTNHKSLYYEWRGPFAIAQAGYAVVAPDYAGQGSKIKQGFMYEAGYLHAADAAYSLIAAKKVIGNLLGDKWVVFGHSEGGMTAWRTNQRLAMAGQEALHKAGKFLGAVASAPALDPLRMFPISVKRYGDGPAYDPFSVYWLQSLAGLFPDQIKVKDWLADIPYQRLAALDKTCFVTGLALMGNFTYAQLYKSIDWVNLPIVKEWSKTYNGQVISELAAPMLIIQGETDVVTPAEITIEDFNKTCKQFPRSQVTLKLYPDNGHPQVTETSKYDVLKWIDSRFEDVPLQKKCVKETIQPLTNRYSTAGVSWKRF